MISTNKEEFISERGEYPPRYPPRYP